jgi:integrase
MPLKLIAPREGKSPNWTIRGAYLGRHVNRSSGTGKRAIAQQVLKQIERQIERGEFSEPGELTFAGAAAAYMRAGGERKYLKPLLEYFGETPVSKIDQTAVDMAAITLYPNATAATRNRSVYTPISAVLRRAGTRLDLRRPSGSAGNKQTAWLWPEQAEAIFAEAEKLDRNFAALLIVLCYTGLRLSEALGLTWNDVRLQDGFAYIPDTKNDDPRAVFVPPVAVAAMGNLDSTSDRVFKFAKGGHLYSLLKACAFKAGVELPERSAFHIFRHTYATWMRRYAGLDEKGLMATGAWKDRKSVDRYTHTVVSEEARKAVMLPTGRGEGREKGGRREGESGKPMDKPKVCKFAAGHVPSPLWCGCSIYCPALARAEAARKIAKGEASGQSKSVVLVDLDEKL